MNRRGVALLVAVVVLAALGVVSTTALVMARAEREAGEAALAEVQARGAMEAAIAEALKGWPGRLTPAIPGEEVVLAEFQAPGPALGSVSLRALGGPVFALVGRGRRWGRLGELVSIGAELLIQLDSAGRSSPGDTLVSARIYPRGWRQLP